MGRGKRRANSLLCRAPTRLINGPGFTLKSATTCFVPGCCNTGSCGNTIVSGTGSHRVRLSVTGTPCALVPVSRGAGRFFPYLGG